jgi:hypothetical protein
MTFVAVRPDNRFGVIYKGWKGDDGSTYTNGDIFNKFVDLRGNDLLVLQKFDQAAKDFGTIATRAGENFQPSDKSHERGEDVINTLFKNDMLVIFDDSDIDEPQLEKLCNEFSSVMKNTPKTKAKDDFVDSARYALVDIPWDWSALRGDLTDEDKRAKETRAYTEQERAAMELDERRGMFIDPRKPRDDEGWGEVDEEFAFWNEQAGS